jgi:hypothetical protein
MNTTRLEGVGVHQHPHPHGSDHSHDHGVRHTADGGPVVLDVGDDIGALVLRTPAAMEGAELEISPVAEPGRRTHVAVHPRYVGSTTVYAAVYYGLVAGTYQLWTEDGLPAMTVEVIGGAVIEAHWQDSGGDSAA